MKSWDPAGCCQCSDPCVNPAGGVLLPDWSVALSRRRLFLRRLFLLLTPSALFFFFPSPARPLYVIECKLICAIHVKFLIQPARRLITLGHWNVQGEEIFCLEQRRWGGLLSFFGCALACIQMTTRAHARNTHQRTHKCLTEPLFIAITLMRLAPPSHLNNFIIMVEWMTINAGMKSRFQSTSSYPGAKRMCMSSSLSAPLSTRCSGGRS